MKITKGMTFEQVKELIEKNDWELYECKEYEAYDDTIAIDLTVMQGDHAVGVSIFHEKVDSLEYIPLWAF